MKTTYLFSLIFLFLFICPIKAQIFQWVKHIESHDPNPSNSIQLDSQGNIYVKGKIRGRVDLDPGPDSSYLGTAGLDRIDYILKLDSLGDFLWAQEQKGEISIGKNDSYYAVGIFSDTTDFDPGPDSLTLVPEGVKDVFVQKFDQTGNPIWLKSLGRTAGEFIQTHTVLDAQDNIYVGGSFLNTMDFDPGPDSILLSAHPNSSPFILKLDSLGNFLWLNTIEINDTSRLFINDLALDIHDNLYITGSFSGRLDIDPGPDSSYLEAERGQNTFLVKFDAIGAFKWGRNDNLNQSWGRQIEVDNSGNIYLIGGFATAWNGAPYIMKFDSTGNVLWNHTYAEHYGASASSIALDQQNNIYIGGDFIGLETTFCAGQEDLTPSFHPAYADMYLRKLDEDGNCLYAFNLVGKGMEDVDDISIDDQGFLYILGSFTDSVDFDPSLQSFVVEVPPRQFTGGDTYILKLDGKKSVGIGPLEAVDIALYPNPNTGIFHIDLPPDAQFAQVHIMDALGNQVLTERLDLRHNLIDLKQLPSGIYFLRLDLNTGPRAVGKIILTD